VSQESSLQQASAQASASAMSGRFVRPEQNVRFKSLKPGHKAPTKTVFVPTTIKVELAIAVNRSQFK